MRTRNTPKSKLSDRFFEIVIPIFLIGLVIVAGLFVYGGLSEAMK